MKTDGRYDVTNLPEAQFEPGSRRRVLRNLLGITRAREMNVIEIRALQSATDHFIRQFDENHRFTAEDIRDMRTKYFAAIQAGIDRNYRPMAEIFTSLIERSLAVS